MKTSRQYEPAARLVKPFQDAPYNDNATTFYELRARISAEYYTPTARLTPLTPKTARNGRPIFPAGFNFSAYKLLKETATPAADEPAALIITELYGYAPTTAFENWTREYVKRWGWLDRDFTTKAGIVFGANNRICGEYDAFPRLDVGTAVSNFTTGDEVIVHLDGFVNFYSAIGLTYTEPSWVESDAKIRRIVGTTLEFANLTGFGASRVGNTQIKPKITDFNIRLPTVFHDLGDVSSYLNYVAYNVRDFHPVNTETTYQYPVYDSEGRELYESPNQMETAYWDGEKLIKTSDGSTVEDVTGWTLKTRSQTAAANCYVIKSYRRKSGKKELAPCRNEILFSETLPDSGQEFIPRNGVGEEFAEISDETIPTISDWKTKCASADPYAGYFIAENPQIEFVSELGLYKKTEKYRKCLL